MEVHQWRQERLLPRRRTTYRPVLRIQQWENWKSKSYWSGIQAIAWRQGKYNSSNHSPRRIRQMNQEISAHELLSLLIDALEHCTSRLRNMPDEDLLYNLYEEFDIGAQSFLHDESLQKLRDAGLIDDQVERDCRAARQRWFTLQSREWMPSEIRASLEWTSLFSLCDSILLRLKSPHGG